MTYVYRCRGCQEESEKEQRITDPPLTTCSSCGSEIFRVMQPIGITFNGPGFHKNDYANRS